MTDFPCALPEEEGVSSRAVACWVEAFSHFQYVHSFRLMRNGKILAEGSTAPCDLDTSHLLFSLSKSFVSCAIGLAVEEGALSLESRIASFFSDKLPAEPDPRYLRMTVRNLLTMASGHDRCATCYFHSGPQSDCVADFFRSPLVYEPGGRFEYNSAATYILSHLIRRATGKGVIDYLKTRLLEPLGIAHFDWERDPQGVELGGWGYSLTLKEVSRFAEMMRNFGFFNGQQLVPRHYMEEATAFQIDNSHNQLTDWKQGYGYQFWRTRKNSFRADGAFGQYALAVPEKNLSLAVFSGMKNMGDFLDLFFDVLYPALGEAPLAADQTGNAEMRAQIQALRFPDLPGRLPSWQGKFKIEDGALKGVVIEKKNDGASFTFDWGGRKETVEASRLGWRENTCYFERRKPRRSFASCAEESGVLTLRLIETETPFQEIWTFEERAGKFFCSRCANLYFYAQELPAMIGMRES